MKTPIIHAIYGNVEKIGIINHFSNNTNKNSVEVIYEPRIIHKF